MKINEQNLPFPIPQPTNRFLKDLKRISKCGKDVYKVNDEALF